MPDKKKTMRMEGICRAAREASRRMAVLDTETKNEALLAMADALEAETPRILEANAADVADAEKGKVAPQLIDRLRLTEAKFAQTVAGVRDVAALPDPVGEELESCGGLRWPAVRTRPSPPPPPARSNVAGSRRGPSRWPRGAGTRRWGNWPPRTVTSTCSSPGEGRG